MRLLFRLTKYSHSLRKSRILNAQAKTSNSFRLLKFNFLAAVHLRTYIIVRSFSCRVFGSIVYESSVHQFISRTKCSHEIFRWLFGLNIILPFAKRYIFSDKNTGNCLIQPIRHSLFKERTKFHINWRKMLAFTWSVRFKNINKQHSLLSECLRQTMFTLGFNLLVKKRYFLKCLNMLMSSK